MNEAKLIEGLFKDLYNADPWLDVTIIGTLEQISAEKAGRKISPEVNSIWEIACHMVEWRNNVLRRVKGEVIETPEHNFFFPVTDMSEEAWQQLLARLKRSQDDWVDFLQKVPEEDFLKMYRGTHTYYELIHGIIQHDVYHLGQIVLLSKHF